MMPATAQSILHLDLLPDSLKARQQWLLWKFESAPTDKKPRKVPYWLDGQRRKGEHGSEQDRAGLGDHAAAVAKLGAGKWDGIGFAFLPGDGLFGVDIDDAWGDAERQARSRSIMLACNSYTEASVSGKGLHIIAQGAAPHEKAHGIGLELFCGKGYFICTGNTSAEQLSEYDMPGEVMPVAPDVISRLVATVRQAKSAGRASTAKDKTPTPHLADHKVPDSGSLLDRARDALYVINPACGYQDWLSIGWALRDGLGETAFALWDTWSSSAGGKYPGEKALQSHWRSFKPSGKPPDEALAVVFKRAIEAGWKPPRSGRPALRVVAGSAAAPNVATPPEDDAPWPDAPPMAEGAAPPPASGSGGKRKKQVDWVTVNHLTEHCALIGGTDTVWDGSKKIIMKIGAFRLLYGTEWVRFWLNSEERRTVMASEVRFEPGKTLDPETQINLFQGFETVPVPGDPQPMLDLLRHLLGTTGDNSSERDALQEHILRWLAYPLQHPGAKHKTALVFQGDEGAGKNLFFDAVRDVYGVHGIIVGQSQLEDKFNDWASCKLMVIGDEVVSRAELVHNKNVLKSLITGNEIQINPKNLPLRTEANHANIVFLSNELKPLHLDDSDRRYMVIFTARAREREFYARIGDWLREENGRGIFMHYLLHLDLGEFDPYAPAPMTQAKRDLQELSKQPAERFWGEWKSGYAGLPYLTCTSAQIYRGFRRWCGLTGERNPPVQTVFSRQVMRLAGDAVDVVKVFDKVSQTGKRFWVVREHEQRDRGEAAQSTWLSVCEDVFQDKLNKFVGTSMPGAD
jgi:putative DNA primase/helicase